MAVISTFDNFFDEFPQKSLFATKRPPQWKEGSYFTIQYVQRVLLCYLCTDFKDNFIFVWDMKHSLSCFWNHAFNWIYWMKFDAHF